jgi:tripartite-type tricarboxylate transporter receptor subunit TctC
VGAKLPYKSIEDLRGVKGFKFATTHHHSIASISAALVAEHYGMKEVKIIPGYRGTSPVGLALARGEVDGAIFNNAANIGFVEKKFSKPPFFILADERIEPWSDSPTLKEVAPTLTTKEETLLEMYYALKSIGDKIICGPAGIPQDRVDFISSALDKVFAMKPFKSQMSLRYSADLNPTKGDAIKTEIDKVISFNPEDVAMVKQTIEKYLR